MGLESSQQRSGQVVLPGERLGVIEEFTPESGTYVKGGAIYSMIVGRTMLDYSKKTVSVSPLLEGLRVPKVGSIVLGYVSHGQSDNAALRIFKIGTNQLSGVFTGVLHISDVHIRYVESMFEVCRLGDIVRGKVISQTNKVCHLSTKEKHLGVVYAFCSQCGYTLEQKRQGMFCPRCGKIEKRKTAFDYGEAMI